MAKILDGRLVSAKIKREITNQVSKLVLKPGLAVVLAGDNQASKVYVNFKEKACQEVGFYSEKIVLKEDISQEELFKVLDGLNNNIKIHGILVQLPLPEKLNHLEQKVLNFINPKKDVDGFHPLNSGKLLNSKGEIAKNLLVPATPKGIIRLLAEYKINLAGKNVVVVGRSNLVGKPVALLCLSKNATVTICHSKTENLKEFTKKADILIAAIGKANFIKTEHVKKGVVVIDVGINRIDDKLAGDVDFKKVEKIARYITPVPGGIGPMTIACLLENTLIAYYNQV